MTTVVDVQIIAAGGLVRAALTGAGTDLPGADSAWTGPLVGGLFFGGITAFIAVVLAIVLITIIVRAVRLSAARASLRSWAQRVGATGADAGDQARRFAALVGQGRVLRAPSGRTVRTGGVEVLVHSVHLSVPQRHDRTIARTFAVAWGGPVVGTASLQVSPIAARTPTGLGQVPVRSGDAALDAVWTFHTAATRVEDGVPEPVRRALHAALEPAAGSASALRRATLRLDGGEAVLWRRGPADGAFAEAATALFARLAG